MKDWIKGIFIFSFLIGISLSDANAVEAKWVKDGLGRSVQIPPEVRRMIATGPGALRLVIYLEGFEKVVGVEQILTLTPRLF
jgi:iron complex transport system substrate-binding protein